jgi:flagellar biosynthesis protein FliQ
MEAGDVGVLVRETMLVTLKLGGPPLLMGLLVGLVVSLLQAIVQVHEPIVAFVPKVAAIGVALLLTGGFMLATLTDFMALIAERVVAAGGQ